MMYLKYWLVALIAGVGLECACGVGWRRANQQGQQDKPVTIALLMMVRDEETNLRNNLPLWEGIIDYYVIGIDSKTTDGSEAAIAEILPPSTPRSVYHFEFDGFGHARSLLLNETWRTFSNASHILISDPDWVPETKTINKGDIDHVHDYFQFQIWDRNNLTTRQSDWLMRHKEGIHMIYRLHEVLVYPVEHTITKEIPWEVYEVETPTSWHVKTGHGHSQSYRRYLFDLSLLEKDLQDEGESPSDHTLYYLGITHFALIESGIPTQIQSEDDRAGFAEEINRRVEAGLHYLNERIERHLNSSNWEQTWASMRWLAYSYQLFVDDFSKAEYWYQRCTAFDPERVDCPIFLARLYYDYKQHSKAWDECVKALSSTYPIRAFGNNFYIYDCFTPVEAAKTLNALMQEEGFDGARFTLGWHLLEYASEKCDRGMLLEADDVLTTLRGQYTALAHTQGLEPEGAASCLPAGQGVEKRLLTKRLGLHVPPCSGQTGRNKRLALPGAGQLPEEGVGRKGQTYEGAGYAVGPRHWQSPTWQDDDHQPQRRRRTSSQDAAASPPPAQAVQQPVRASLGSDKGKQGEPWWQAAWRQLPSAHRDGATQAQGKNSSREAGDEPGVLDRGGSGASQHAAAVGWGSGTVHGQQEAPLVSRGSAEPQLDPVQAHRGKWEAEDRVKKWRPAAWQGQQQPPPSPPSVPTPPSAHAAAAQPHSNYAGLSMKAVHPPPSDKGAQCSEASLVAGMEAQQADEAMAWAVASIKRTGAEANAIRTLSQFGTPQQLSGALSTFFLASLRSSRLSADLCSTVDGDEDEEELGYHRPLCRRLTGRRAGIGAGLEVTTRYKLEHDVEQFRYLSSRGVRSHWLNNTVIPAFEQVMSTYQEREGHAPIWLSQIDKALIGNTYNRALHVPNLPELPSDDDVINPKLDFEAIQREYLSSTPGLIVIDDILTPKALSLVYEHLAESTLWFESKPTLSVGYVGAYLDDGLHQPIADVLRRRLPALLEPHPLHYMWAYKHDQRYRGVSIHADAAAINMNLWVTPNSACMDHSGGGLVVYKAAVPHDWNFDRYNGPDKGQFDDILGPSGYSNYTVPYRCNRMVIFNSALLHQTDHANFKPGYKNKRINLTFLFGNREAADAESTTLAV